jgi:transposase
LTCSADRHIQDNVFEPGNTRISALEIKMAQRDTVIATMQGELTQRDTVIATMQGELTQRDTVIATLQVAVAQRDTVIATLRAQLNQAKEHGWELQKQVDILQRRLGENSQNSSRPPSSDSPKQRKLRPKRSPSGRPRGAQMGHQGHRRALLPPEKVTQQVELFPTHCTRCHKRLQKCSTGEPARHQVLELPEFKMDVIEYQRHHVRCDCGQLNTARLPDGVPKTLCGPRLTAFIGLLVGTFHLSRREGWQFLGDVFDVGISVGRLSKSEDGVSQALARAEEQAKELVLKHGVKNIDATGWQEAGNSRSLWVIASPEATWFTIALDGSKETLKKLFGRWRRGILMSDRGVQFGFWAMRRRQICWSHLIRKFLEYWEQGGRAGRIGDKLLRLTELIFSEWHRFCDGEMTRKQLVERTAGLRVLVEACLEEGVALAVRKKKGAAGKKKGRAREKESTISGSCKHILKHREALWTFMSHPGVEPTNNHAEQQLRSFVLWRKKCFGSQSERGCRFAQRIMTVVHTLRKQKRPVFKFLVDACQAYMGAGVMPSLLPVMN